MVWEDIQKHIDTQVKGFFFIIQSLKPLIKSKHKIKFIIILTEYCTGKPPSGLSHYITAKYSLMGFGKSMAVELAKYNSTVNMISPGMVTTNLIKGLPPKLIEMTAETNPLKRIANPQDVSNTVLFLCSDGSDYLNGVNILVNGGGMMQ
jgi:3-oxoacyl-[acyl-carrier protein] reductase